MLHIVYDQAIPLVSEFFCAHKLTAIDPQHMNKKLLHDADALLVRSLTKVDRQLLNNSAVRFVGSMTAGVDNLDIGWLKQQGIHWANAKGANSQAVTDYVIASIAWLQQQGYLPAQFRAGIIGAGAIGSKVIAALETLGAAVLVNDPPRAQRENHFQSCSLNDFYELDLISIHTPLVSNGAYPTKALIGTQVLARQNHCCVINTARGAVLDCQALQAAKKVQACLDVYPGEPHISPRLIQKTLLSTPHIAGYSANAKRRATYRVYCAFADYFGVTQERTERGEQQAATLTGDNWQSCVLAAYNPNADSEKFRDTLTRSDDIARCFLQARNNYPLRPEFSNFKVMLNPLPAKDQKIIQQLGFQSG